MFRRRKEQRKTDTAQLEGLKSALADNSRPINRWEYEELIRRQNRLEQDVRAITNLLGIHVIHNQSVIQEVPKRQTVGGYADEGVAQAADSERIG